MFTKTVTLKMVALGILLLSVLQIAEIPVEAAEMGVCENAFVSCTIDAVLACGDPIYSIGYTAFCFNGYLYCKTFIAPLM